jgi:hypothetical protein
MKRLLLQCLLLAIAMAGSGAVQAQNMIPNGDFESNCGAGTSILSCLTFSPTCVAGWQTSHGTPYLDFAGGIAGPTAVIMGSRTNGSGFESEGIFCNLNTPTDPQKRYLICFRYRTWGSGGTILVRLGNGITYTVPTSCGQAPPNPSPSYTAYSNAVPAVVTAGPWQTVSLYASPLQVYTQLFVYPVSNTPDALWLEVDGFEMLDCASALEFTPGSLPAPSGFFARNSTIRAYSPGGWGTVTADPNVNTTFRAAQYVLLEPNFVASPNPGTYFLAEIGTCGCNVAVPKTDFVTRTPQEEGGMAALKVYPNPSAGEVTVYSEFPLETVTVSDLMGKVLLQQRWEPNLNTQSLSLSEFPNGVYLLQGKTRSGQCHTQRLVKQ